MLPMWYFEVQPKLVLTSRDLGLLSEIQ